MATPPSLPPEEPHQPRAQTRVVVDLSAFSHNLRLIRNRCEESCRLMAVIKADAYGHGAETMARTAIASGVDFLGVARFNEARTLRQAGISAPILIFGSIPPLQIPYAAAHDIRISVGDLEVARSFSRVAEALEVPVKVHIKADTGMGRLGLAAADTETAAQDALAISRLPGFDVEGLYTHFANADVPDKTHTLNQFQAFTALKARLQELGVVPAICHAANSAATLDSPRPTWTWSDPESASTAFPTPRAKPPRTTI